MFIFENQLFQETYQKLSKDTISKMDGLISSLATYDETEIDYNTDGDAMSFSELRADPGRIGVESVREVHRKNCCTEWSKECHKPNLG